MSLELDHVFICVEEAPAAERALADFGLQFGLRAIHGGQGTANACAFFDNAYLELLSPHDDQELQSLAVRPLTLWERVHWRQTGASPFAIAFRTDNIELSINTWPYEAAFLPPGKNIPIVTAANAGHEPLIFLIPATLPIRRRPPQAHRGKHRSLTRVTVSGPRVSALSADVRKLCDPEVLAIRQAPEHQLELDWAALVPASPMISVPRCR
jgi:glyoxalase-like protein